MYDKICLNPGPKAMYDKKCLDPGPKAQVLELGKIAGSSLVKHVIKLGVMARVLGQVSVYRCVWVNW